MDYPLPLCSSRDRQAAQQLIESNDLCFESDSDDLIGLFRDGRLAACGARRGRVLKMLVVDAAFRGEGLIGGIIAELMRLGRAAGQDGFLIFTRRCSVPAFSAAGFKALSEQGPVVLLEHGNKLYRYLMERAVLMRSGDNAAVMLNANPFTRGHAALVEQAARSADTVYVFVFGEGHYLFPLDVRLEFARRGTAHIDNAVVTDLAHYRIHPELFPRYFLRPEDNAEQLRIGIEGELFARHIAPHFHITRRVVGSEPLDPAGRTYNPLMKRCLESFDIRLQEVERVKSGDLWINTKRVQKALRDGDMASLAAALPEPVLDYLSTLKSLPFLRD
jgi:[citrate (pro-3S)-lyase] ligase